MVPSLVVPSVMIQHWYHQLYEVPGENMYVCRYLVVPYNIACQPSIFGEEEGGGVGVEEGGMGVEERRVGVVTTTL